jgi:hypothetical protein
MRDAQGMAHRSARAIPGDLRARWKWPDWTGWLGSAPWTAGILLPRKSLRAAYANSLKGMPIMPSLKLDQPEGSLDHRALLRDALTALDQLPFACAQFWKQPLDRPALEQLEASIRKALNSKEAYSMVPGRDPENNPRPRD